MQGNDEPMHDAAGVATQRSKDYWRNSTDTFNHASAAYYDRVDEALNHHVLPMLHGSRHLLDVGCGNGRFTFSLARAVEKATAVDISPALIEQANAEARERGVSNIAFGVLDLAGDKQWPDGTFDVIACMGVTSVLVDERDYRATIAQFTRCLALGGCLIMRDTLSRQGGSERVLDREMPSVYRDRYQYVGDLMAEGFRPKMAILLNRAAKRQRDNCMIVFFRGKPARNPLLRRLAAKWLFWRMRDLSASVASRA